MDKIDEILERGEARTKVINDLFPSGEGYTKQQILTALRERGIISGGLFGRLKGEYIIRTTHPTRRLWQINEMRFYPTESGRYYFAPKTEI